ncbi:MAG: hypothetical protein GXP33_03650 [Spirochaetes bacterium]|nr:hypothetical protein [Spirochaetota bacterium]
MKKYLVFILLLLTFNIFADTTGKNGENGETIKEKMAPKEPEIVLPPVILEVEDLTVESVETALPETKELLPPERNIPLPKAGELEIKEPEVKLLQPGRDIKIKQRAESSLSAEGTLGIGSKNHILSSISLYKLGKKPTFKVRFNHEMLDGFGIHPAGSGFFKRTDNLSGSLNFVYSGFGFSGEGSYSDNEKGFQGRGAFITGINRFLNEKILINTTLLKSLRFNTGLSGDFSSLLLTGETPEQDNELLLSPDTGLALRLKAFRFGITARYTFRTLLESSAYNLHRLRVKGLVSYDAPFGLSFAGEGGWFFNSDNINTFPFNLTISGSPLNFLNIRLSGGYGVNEYNLKNLLQETTITAIPASIVDDPYWFGTLNTKLSLLKNTVLSVGTSLYWNTAMPDLDTGSADSGGFYPFYQRNAFQLNTELGFRWNITSLFILNTGWRRRWADRSLYRPLDSITFELSASDKNSIYGGDLDVSYLSGITGQLQFPDVSIDGFYQISDYIRVVTEIDDILLISGTPRYDALMLEEPGFRATFKIQINF